MRLDEVALASKNVRRLGRLLPRQRREVLVEAWLADVADSRQVGLSPRDIVRGVALVILTRGVVMWASQPWVRPLVFVGVFLSIVALLPAWLSVLVLIFAAVSWLIFAPVREPRSQG